MKVVTANVNATSRLTNTANSAERKGEKTQMSATISGNENAKSQSSTNAIDRIAKTAEHWFETANDEFGFGVIYGLRLALDILEGRK